MLKKQNYTQLVFGGQETDMFWACTQRVQPLWAWKKILSGMRS